ncbi:MAG: M15 family metallopeptidase [Methylococcales bacterium]|nr:M15 family metallopeptidase [Methylococcales bacterium]
MKSLAAAIFLSLFSHYAQAVCDKNANKLIKAYPEHLVSCENNAIVWRNGERQLYDDGKQKTFEQLLAQADIEDMFAFPYLVGVNSYNPPALNVDAGRIRNEEFFKRLYGATKSDVQDHLTTIKWLPKSDGEMIKIQKTNDVAIKLEQVSKELDELPTELKKYVINTSGTFNWRVISGTDRLSNHSFAVAIDINTKYADYWQWAKGEYQYKNSIPHQIVEIFEKYGFIWGGKWYHYDTMHFEYRPELLS